MSKLEMVLTLGAFVAALAASPVRARSAGETAAEEMRGLWVLAAFRASRIAGLSAAERQRLDRLAATDSTAWTTAFGDAWSAFRRDRLTALVTRLATVAKAARAGLVVSASVAPNADDARAHLLQDWQAWAAGKVVDVVCSTASTPTLDDFTRAMAHARQRAGATPFWAGISTDRLPATGTADQVRAARRAGVAGMLFFSYDTLAAADGRAAASFAGLKRVLQETTSGSGTLR